MKQLLLKIIKNRALVFMILVILAGCGSGGDGQEFIIRIKNIDTGDSLTASDGTNVTVSFSTGSAAVHYLNVFPYFREQQPASFELELLAEAGIYGGVSTRASRIDGVLQVINFLNTDLGEDTSPIMPGDSYTLFVKGSPGEYLSLITMFVESNDIFIAPINNGISLYSEDEKPISGDITSLFTYWNAGTEVDEEVGLGMYQAPRQSSTLEGPAENSMVKMVDLELENLPPLNNSLMITIEPVE